MPKIRRAVAAGGIVFRESVSDDGEAVLDALLVESRRDQKGIKYAEGGDTPDLQIPKGHRKRRWWPPGMFETPRQTAGREVREEVGVAAVAGALLGEYERIAQAYNRRNVWVGEELKHVYVFAMEPDHDAPLQAGDERTMWARVAGPGAEATFLRMRHTQELEILQRAVGDWGMQGVMLDAA